MLIRGSSLVRPYGVLLIYLQLLVTCLTSQSAETHCRNDTRHIHCRLHSINVGAGDFLTTPRSPNVPIENGSNVRPPRAPSLMRTFTTGKGNSSLLYIIYQYPTFIDELRD